MACDKYDAVNSCIMASSNGLIIQPNLRHHLRQFCHVIEIIMPDINFTSSAKS